MHKGVEQPQVIVYVLFVVVLTLAGIYVAFTQLGGVSIAFTFQDYASRLNIVATKFMLTPECFAAEDSYYKEGNSYYQVNGGIIDWTVFNKTTYVSTKCLSGEKPVWAKLAEINGKYSDTIWSCDNFVCTGEEGCDEYSTKDDCEYYSCEWVQSCSEPSPGQLANPDEWTQISRSYFVLIKNGTTIDQGTLTLRVKG